MIQYAGTKRGCQMKGDEEGRWVERERGQGRGRGRGGDGEGEGAMLPR